MQNFKGTTIKWTSCRTFAGPKARVAYFFLKQFLNPRIAFFLGGVRADPRCVRLRYDVYFVEPIVFERSVVGALFGNSMLCSIWRELCW